MQNETQKITTDIQANTFIAMREHVCGTLCPGGRRCANLKCLGHFLSIVGEIEMKLEGHDEPAC